MNKLLVDTHVLLWMMEDSPRLGSTARANIRVAVAGDSLLVSAITPWEIGLLAAKKRIQLQMETNTWMERVLALNGVHLAALSPAIAIASSNLPFEMHADPADRILVATARNFGATLITADELLLRHGAAGYFRCLSAI